MAERAKRGSVWRRKRGARVEWCAQYDAGRSEAGRRKRVTITGASKAEVVAELKRRVGDADQGRVVAAGARTVADLVKLYLAAKQVDATTAGQYAHVCQRHVTPRIGHVRLRNLTPFEVQRFVTLMGEDQVKPRARQAAFDMLSRVLTFGVDIDLLPINPCARVERPSAPKAKVRALDAQQAAHLLKVARAAGPAPWAACALAIGCGLRRGEVFGACWGGISFDPPEVRITQSLKKPAKGAAYLGAPKSAAGRRVIPMPPFVIEALLAHRAASVGTATPHPGRLLFLSSEGTPTAFSNWCRRVWVPLRTAAGLPEIGFHSLRHTFATLNLTAGTDVRTTAALLGHEKVDLTLNTYTDYLPANGQAAIARLDRVLTEAAAS